MKYPIYAIRDFKTGFLTPTVEPNVHSAVRNFEHACLRSDSLFFTHPSDYALFLIGEYDTDSGVIASVTPVEEVITASQAIESALAHGYRSDGGVSDAGR